MTAHLTSISGARIQRWFDKKGGDPDNGGISRKNRSTEWVAGDADVCQPKFKWSSSGKWLTDFDIQFCFRTIESILKVLLWSFQALNIPVPNPITENHAVPSKRARLDDSARGVTEEQEGPYGTRVLALPSGVVTCNTPICELITVVKPLIRELVEDSNLLKMWISFMSKCDLTIEYLNLQLNESMKLMRRFICSSKNWRWK